MTPPTSSPVEEALNRLESNLWGYPRANTMLDGDE